MLIRFTKMHGLGNDFLLLDLISQKARISESQIRDLADRRTGVGFDQLLIVEPPDDPDVDFRYRIYNADGTEAEQCGNGARCFARFVRDRGLTSKSEIRLQTNTGNISCTLLKDGQIMVNMGAPVLSPSAIPFVADTTQVQYHIDICADSNTQCHLPTSIDIAAVNMGNPHMVLRVDSIESAPVEQMGPVLEHHPRFPERANVGFMEVVNRSHIKLRVFERGVGETRACGTGACAAMVAGRLQGVLDENVKVQLPGGDLDIAWAGENSDVLMTGPASRVYEGRLHI